MSRLRAGILAAALLLAACGAEDTAPPTAPSGAGPRPTAIPGAAHARNGVLDVTVLVDAMAPQTSRAEIERVFERAAAVLWEKSRESLRLTDVVYGLSRGPGVSPMASAYLASVASSPPEALLVFTNDTTAYSFGGYSFFVVPPYPYASEFPSPRAGVGSTRIYIAVVEFDHPYARCGYDTEGRRVSDFNTQGECRNAAVGSQRCVSRGSGRAETMCPNSLNDLYADHDRFTACTVAHEILHPFGIDPNANLDHYGTPSCVSRTGMTAQAAADLVLAQENCGLCPDVFARLTRPR
jgi:hypothetical protein